MRLARTVSVLMTIGAFTMVLVSIVPVRAWPIELLASFRLQITWICLLSALLAFLLRMRICATVGFSLVVVQIALLFPLFVSAEREQPVEESSELSILTLNVEWLNRDGNEIVDLILSRRPDIVAVQEVDSWWRNKLALLAKEYPYQTFDHMSSRPGVAILSRFEPVREEWFASHARPYVSLLFRDEDRTFRIINLHALPPRVPLLYRLRNQLIDEVARRIARSHVPTFLVGDMNVTPWSPVLKDFEKSTGLKSVRAGRGALPTYPSWNMLFGVPIDHIYHPESYSVREVYRVSVPGSDHKGLYARLYPAAGSKGPLTAVPEHDEI